MGENRAVKRKTQRQVQRSVACLAAATSGVESLLSRASSVVASFPSQIMPPATDYLPLSPLAVSTRKQQAAFANTSVRTRAVLVLERLET